MFTVDELRYLEIVLSVASSFTIARNEQIDLPSVKHKELENKIRNKIVQLTV